MRRLFGLPERRDPAGGHPAPSRLRVGAGDMLSWGGGFACVEAVLAVGDGAVDVCLVSDGVAESVVVFDEESGVLWVAGPRAALRAPVVAEGVWPGGHARARRGGPIVTVEYRGEAFGADLTTTGFTCDWVNAYGRPTQRNPGLELEPFIDKET